MAEWERARQNKQGISDIALYSVNELLRVQYPSLSAKSVQSFGLRVCNDILSDKRLCFSHRGHSDYNKVSHMKLLT